MKLFTSCLVIIFVFVSLLTRNAYAYIDPGTGSYIVQIILGAVVGGLYAIKLFWKNIAAFLKGLFIRKNKISDKE